MIQNLKVGLAISSYINNYITLNHLKESIKSLYKNTSQQLIDKIIIVDDGSNFIHLDDYYNSIKKKIKVYKNQSNKGISVTKNLSMIYLKDCDIIILSDNDNLFQKDWDKFYLENYVKSDIKFICQSNLYDSDPPQKIIEMNDVKIGLYEKHQGNFIIINKEIFNKVGAFPKLSEKYGAEHVNYSHRVNMYLKREIFTYDFINSNKYVQNINKTYTFTHKLEKDRMSTINGKESDYLLNSGKIYYEFEKNL